MTSLCSGHLPPPWDGPHPHETKRGLHTHHTRFSGDPLPRARERAKAIVPHAWALAHVPHRVTRSRVRVGPQVSLALTGPEERARPCPSGSRRVAAAGAPTRSPQAPTTPPPNRLRGGGRRAHAGPGKGCSPGGRSPGADVTVTCRPPQTARPPCSPAPWSSPPAWRISLCSGSRALGPRSSPRASVSGERFPAASGSGCAFQFWLQSA